MKFKLKILLLIFVFLITTGQACKRTPAEVQEAIQPVTLTYWRVFDGPDTMSGIIQDYKALHPNVNIEYRKLRFEEYEDALLNALAEDRGPDIFSIHNTWIGKHQSKIEPMPESYVLPFQEEVGTVKKEVVTRLRTVPGLSIRELRSNFLDVVKDDVLRTAAGPQGSRQAIFGLPLSVDTLALYYNQDLLKNAGIPTPPIEWKEFQDHIKELTVLNEQGDILQAGAAIGTADNIERSFDIISLLMMQNGAQMTDERGNATFSRIPESLRGVSVPPGEGALNFYVDFANPVKEVYTWNDQMPNSVEAFTQGKVAYLFGYSYHLPAVRALAPKLNFDIAKVPQIQGDQGEINYANYWIETVSKKSQNPQWAWDFIKFATSAGEVQKYLVRAQKPTALKSLVNSQLDDVDLGYFASQLLTARSWYRGNNPGGAEVIFNEMINSVLKGEASAEDAIRLAETKINQTIR